MRGFHVESCPVAAERSGRLDDREPTAESIAGVSHHAISGWSLHLIDVYAPPGWHDLV